MVTISAVEIKKRLRIYRQFLGHRRHIQDILSSADCPKVAAHARSRSQSYDLMLDKMIELFPELR